MNFDEYEKKYQTRYAEFASVVRRAIDYSYRLILFKAPGAIQSVCGSR